MSSNQFLVMAVLALAVTVPVVLLIPRARTSPFFNGLLWAATLVVCFLLAWVAAAMAKDAGTFSTPAVGDTPLLPALLGALGGALAVNLPLWLADRLAGGAGENDDDEFEGESEEQAQEGPPSSAEN